MALLARRFAKLALLLLAVAVAGLVLCVCLEVEALELLIGGLGLGFDYYWLRNLNLFVNCGGELLTAHDTAEVRVAHGMLAE